jgi:glycosyltransferase involved in cell wall biosynthesis
VSRRLRVIHLIETFGLGGAEVLLAHTLPSLVRHADVRVRALTGPDYLRHDFHRAGIDAAILDADASARPASLPRFARRLRRELAAAPADILHTHLFHPTVIGRMVRLTIPRGLRLITTLHNPDYTNPEIADRWHAVVRQLFDWTSAVAANDALVAVSEAVAADFRLHMAPIGPWGRIEVIHNAMDIGELVRAVGSVNREDARRRQGWAPGEIAVLTIARLTEQKNLDTLIRAVEHLRQDGIDAVGAVFGDGPLRSILENKAGPFVRFRGLAPRDEIIDALAACDIYAQPSHWEAFGMAILEAMAAERPVVASAVGGIREVVEHQRTGILVPPDDLHLFADALAGLARDPERRRQLGIEGRRRARELFGLENWADKTRALYESVSS